MLISMWKIKCKQLCVNKEKSFNSECGLLGGSVVKNPPAMQETPVRFLGWEGPLEKEMATHSSILAWEIPWRGACRATVHGVEKESDTT